MKIRIYTMTHKKFNEPKDSSLYIPLQVGSASGQELGYLKDNTGDNISTQNCYYGELTGLYWIWKNDFDSDYIGICHYRRFFVDANRKLLKKEDFENILIKYDVIVSTQVQAKGTYEENYAEAHNINDLHAVGRAIAKLYPEDYPVFEQIIHQPAYYFGNLMVTSRELFCEYAEWLFSIFDEASKEIDVSSYDMYHKRVYGFLSEQRLMVWIAKKKLKAYECPISINAEKAETVELKLAIAQLIKQREISKARELFYGIVQIRPDVRLEMSDVKGELPIIEQLLYIMEEEEARGLTGLLSYSVELPKLIEHYKKVLDILKNTDEDEWESNIYFKETHVTGVMRQVIVLNN